MYQSIKFIDGAYLDCSAMKDWKMVGKAAMTENREIVIDHTDGAEESKAVLSLTLNQKRIAQVRMQAESMAESVDCINAYDYSIM